MHSGKWGSSSPREKREQFSLTMKTAVHADALERIARNSMVKVFTADELHALADFYGSKDGASAMNKFGSYMALIMPALQQELQQAVRRIQEKK